MWTAAQHQSLIINLVLKLKPAVGGKGGKGSAIGNFLVREAKVIALGELMWMFGDTYTATEIYNYFSNCRLLTALGLGPVVGRWRRRMGGPGQIGGGGGGGGGGGSGSVVVRGFRGFFYLFAELFFLFFWVFIFDVFVDC